MIDDILSYLDDKGLSYKLNGRDALLTCPNCHKKEKLYINIDSGVYHCFYCSAQDQSSLYAKGHISQLMKEWGDIVDIKPSPNVKIEKEDKDFTLDAERYHYDLMNDIEAQKQMLVRGFDEAAIQKFKFGVTRRDGQNWWVIPSFQDGKAKLLKLRKLLPDENKELKKYIRVKDGKSVLWNGDAIKDKNEVIVCESELDAATLVANGYDNVIASTSGASALLEEWYDTLLGKNKIYICFDADDAGQHAAQDVWAKRLGVNRCYNVLLPKGEDVNSFFKKYGKEEFDKRFKEAKRFKVDGVFSIREVLHEFFRGDIVTRYPLPWPSVNELLDEGLVKKRMVVLGGVRGTGKTSFALQIAYHFAKVHKIPSLYVCLEMPEVSLVTKVVQLEKDLHYNEVKSEDAMTYLLDVGQLPLYFGYTPRISLQQYYNTVKEVRNRYGVELFIFDNLQRMVRTGEEKDIARASGAFKDMAMELDVLSIIISQPRKLNADRYPTLDDMKGSGSIGDDADEGVLLYRAKNKDEKEKISLEPECVVWVEKSRFSSGGQTQLYFHGSKARFDELEVNRKNRKLSSIF